MVPLRSSQNASNSRIHHFTIFLLLLGTQPLGYDPPGNLTSDLREVSNAPRRSLSHNDRRCSRRRVKWFV